VFFYFVRFGYLYLQTVKEVASTHDIIDTVLPYNAEPNPLREALTQTCRSNYIVQTIVVFLYAPKVVNHAEFLTIEGPLSGSGPWRSMFIKFIMILTTIAVEWVIAVSQFLMLTVVLSLTNWFIASLLVVAFFLYYLFYFEYVGWKAWKLREKWITSLSVIGFVLIAFSMSANVCVIWNYEYAPNVFYCRMSSEKIREISPPAAALVSFLFSERADIEKTKPDISKRAGDEVPLCQLGRRT